MTVTVTSPTPAEGVTDGETVISPIHTASTSIWAKLVKSTMQRLAECGKSSIQLRMFACAHKLTVRFQEFKKSSET